jgi:nitrous oxidase accessory protein NosD
MKFNHFLMGAALLALSYSCTKDNQHTPVEEANLEIENRAQVVLPAGSVDGLAGAIADAGPNGTVIVQAGTHYLNSTVEISHRVTIKGQPGAVIIADVPALLDYDAVLQPALYINGGAKTVIEGLNIQAANDPAGNAILVFNANQVTIRNNSFTNFQFTILVEQSNQVTIQNNTVTSTFTWATVAFYPVHGIVIINGTKAQVRDNTVSQAIFGIWACDLDGIATGNEMFANVLGLILCTVPPGSGWLRQSR